MSPKLWAPLLILGVMFGACSADPPSTGLTSSAASSGAGGGAGAGGGQGTGGLGEAPTCQSCKALFCEAEQAACDGEPECSAVLGCLLGKCWAEWQPCYDAYPAGVGPAGALNLCLDDHCESQCLAADPCFDASRACELNAECTAIWDCINTTCPTECPAEDPNCALTCWAGCKDAHPDGAADWQAGLDCLNAQCM